MALEGLEGPVAAKATYVDAHVCAAGGKGGVVLPVDIQCWGCGIFECTGLHSLRVVRFTSTTVQPQLSRKHFASDLLSTMISFYCSGYMANSLYLSEKGTAAWLLLCVHPK